MKLKNKKINDQSGQSSIEFLSVIIFVFAFSFMFLKIAFNYTNGFFLHYANFMASRAYLVTDRVGSPAAIDGQALRDAQAVFDSFRVTSLLGGIPVDFRANDPEFDGRKGFVGTIASYQDKFSIGKLFGGDEPMEFYSESFLGREPSRTECIEQVCQAFEQNVGRGFSCSEAGAQTTLVDNGC